MARPGPTAAGKASRAAVAREARRGIVLATGYFASAIVSASVAAGSHTAYAYLVDGTESQAGLSRGDMLVHASLLALAETAAILALSLPVAWLPLAAALVLSRRVLRGRLVACLVSGAVTGTLLSVWILTVFSMVPDDGDRMPLWQSVVSNLPFAVPAGIVGGLVLWAAWSRALPP